MISAALLGIGVVVLLHLELEALALLRARTVFALGVLALLAAVVMRRDLFRERHTLRNAILIAGASVATCAVASWQSDTRSFSVYDASLPAGVMIVGWLVYLLLLRPWTPAMGEGRLELGTRAAAIAMLAAFCASLGVQYAYFHGVGGMSILDEALYYVQSRWMDAPGFGWRMPVEEVRFFGIRHTWYDGNVLRTQYPPGWPWLLWLARRARVDNALPALLLAVATLATYLLGRRLHDRTTGALAALIFATLPLVVKEGGRFLSHSAGLAALALCGWLLLGGSASRGGGRWVRLLLAGACVGLAFAVRPLTALAVGASLGLWIAVREGWPWRRLAATALLVAAGALPFVAATAWYNARTTGHPARFGYAASNGELHDLGFGLRGVIEFDTQGRQSLDTQRFTVGDAATELARRARDFALLLPAALLIPLVVLARQHGARLDPRVLLAFMVLPAVHFFYWYPGTRFLVELVPFVTVGVAALLMQVIRGDRRVGLLLVALLLAGNVMRVTVAALQSSPAAAVHRALFAQVEAQVEAAGGRDSALLLFVPDGRTGPAGVLAFWLLYRLNGSTGAHILVARDLGADDAQLARRYPDRRPFRLVAEVPPGAQAGQVSWVLRPLAADDAGSAAAAPEAVLVAPRTR